MTITERVPATQIGRRIPRPQDPRLLRGHGRYLDDIDDLGMVHAAIIRSPYAHALIQGFDASAALNSGNALLVLGPDELEAMTFPLPTVWRILGQRLTHVPIATRTVRYVGQPLGIVVARSRAVAEDLQACVRIDFLELPPVIGAKRAAAEDAPLLYPEAGTNTAGTIAFGDPIDVVEEALAKAKHVIERELTVQRVAYSSMEPRGIIAEWISTTEQMTIHASTQVPHLVREEVAVGLGLRVDQIRVISPDIGGAFGGKTTLAPDEAMVCAAAKALGGRVKWVEDRAEALVASYQGRGQSARAELGVDGDGRFVAFGVEITGDIGAFATTAGAGPIQVCGLTIEGPYRFPVAASTVTGVYTNAVPIGAYRGYGMQEAAWIRERMVDEAARHLGMDPVQLRRRNLLSSADMPYTTRTGLTYDSGDYRDAFERAAEIADEQTATETATNDRVRRGTAITANVEVTGMAPSALHERSQIHMAGWEAARIRVNPDGTVTIFSGVTSLGQGIETALAQIAADHLSIPIEWISVQLGDTATATYSNFGSQASRSLTLAGAALIMAIQELRPRLIRLAATALGTESEHVEHDGDEFRAFDRRVSWQEVAHRGWMGWGRGDSEAIQLEETGEFDPPGVAFAYAMQGAEVAVDLDTGKIRVERYWSVNDSGVVVNPLIAEGQIVGGIAQGLGIALLEEAVYDQTTGQPLCTTLLDYALPLAEDVPDITIEHRCTPSPLIPGGFKGLGEGGIMPPAATVGNAVATAVPEIAADITRTPLTPGRMWEILNKHGLAS